MSDTAKRLGLWALGRVLPRRQEVAFHVRHFAQGLVWFICGGMLLAAVFLAVLAVAYLALVAEGLSVAAAGTIVGVVAVLAMAICFLQAVRSFDKAAAIAENLHLRPPALPRIQADLDLQEGVSVLFNAFMDGLRGHERTERGKKAATAEEEETILSRVEVEREYDVEKDIIRFRPRARHTDEV